MHSMETYERTSLLFPYKQMVHGCRQLVSWDVGLSPATSATLVISCQHSVGHSSQTAVDNTEEGGDDVKSSCLLRLGLHTCYNGRYKEMRYGNMEPNSKSRSQFGLWAATRPHEDGVASNPGSARQGECVPGSCTHRPSSHGSWEYPKSAS